MAPLDQFILLGDSITEMSSDQTRGFAFAAQLQDVYRRKLDVINRGFSGYNTRDALKVLPSYFPTPAQAKVRFLLLFLGTNDASLPTANTGQYVPLAEFKDNLLALATHRLVQAHKDVRVLLVTPPPFEETTMEAIDWEFGAKWINRTAEHTAGYAQAVREVGGELEDKIAGRVGVVDLWSACMAGAGSIEDNKNLPGAKQLGKNEVLAKLLFDGLHLSPDGYRILYDEVMEVIGQKWPDQHPENLPILGYNPWENSKFSWGQDEEAASGDGVEPYVQA